MKVIILSAGQGRRLLPHTADRPKCVVPVAGLPLLTWQLREIAKCGSVSRVTVVTGFATDRAEAVIAAFRNECLEVSSLYNPFFGSSDNLGTCWIARHEMHEPFVLINGDTLFEAAVLGRLLESQPQAPITLTVDRKAEYDADDMKVIHESGRLCHVGKKLSRRQVNGESIGVTRFDATGAEWFRDELDRSMRFSEGHNRWYLSAIDAIAQKNPVGVCPIEGLRWCEVDTPEDLELAESMLADWFDIAEQSPRASAPGG